MGVAFLTVGASVTQTNEALRGDPNLPVAGGVGCGAMKEEKHKAKFDSTGRSSLTRSLGWYRYGATGR
ncbi:unnamed protein product [Lota lota]